MGSVFDLSGARRVPGFGRCSAAIAAVLIAAIGGGFAAPVVHAAPWPEDQEIATGGKIWENGDSSNGLLYKTYWLVMQSDGNLVYYYSGGYPGVPRFATGTTPNSPAQNGHRGNWAVFQWDANLVVYTSAGTPIWASHTDTIPDRTHAHLRLQNDGNLVIYDGGGVPRWWSPMANTAETPSLGGGDCWRPSTGYTCKYGWLGRTQTVNYRAVDHFSSQFPLWFQGISAGVQSWNGPTVSILFSMSPTDTRIFYEVGSNANIPNGALGKTEVCDFNGSCNQGAVSIYYSTVWLNKDVIPSNSLVLTHLAAAHETGHGIGLAHNTSDTQSVMYPSNAFSDPNAHDFGLDTNCSGYGIRCIYGR